jgi:hypothetical protein
MTKMLIALKQKSPAEFEVGTYSLTFGFVVVGVLAVAATQFAVQVFGA